MSIVFPAVDSAICLVVDGLEKYINNDCLSTLTDEMNKLTWDSPQCYQESRLQDSVQCTSEFKRIGIDSGFNTIYSR